MQYEQYEQEVKNLQRLIEEAHRIIQDRPVSTSNIQELQAQIHHHEVRKHTLTPALHPHVNISFPNYGHSFTAIIGFL